MKFHRHILNVTTVCFLITVTLHADTHYVDKNSPNPTLPYTSWETAATNIQNAVDEAIHGDVVLVTNGVYNSGVSYGFGESLPTRVIIPGGVTVKSVNGPQNTYIVGASSNGTNGPIAIRCITLHSESKLSGFTITNGHTLSTSDNVFDLYGGGIYYNGGWECCYGVVTNCVIINNSSHVSGGGIFANNPLNVFNCVVKGNTANFRGGGICGSIVYNSIIISNTVGYAGGGMDSCHANNCMVSYNSSGELGGGLMEGSATNCIFYGNSATLRGGGLLSTWRIVNSLVLHNYSGVSGGGIESVEAYNCNIISNKSGSYGGGSVDSIVNNCIIFNNYATTGMNYYTSWHSTEDINFTCTTPLPNLGTGNFTNKPFFMDSIGENYRLLPNSPCIDSGTNLTGIIPYDLDGASRPIGGVFDIGAYEFDPVTWDTDEDKMPDSWENDHNLNPTNAIDATFDPDNDGVSNLDEWIANTDPSDPNSFLHIISISNEPGRVITFPSSNSRKYTLERSTGIRNTTLWTNVPLETDKLGVGGTKVMMDSEFLPYPLYYRVKASLP